MNGNVWTLLLVAMALADAKSGTLVKIVIFSCSVKGKIYHVIGNHIMLHQTTVITTVWTAWSQMYTHCKNWETSNIMSITSRYIYCKKAKPHNIMSITSGLRTLVCFGTISSINEATVFYKTATTTFHYFCGAINKIIINTAHIHGIENSIPNFASLF